MSKNKYTNDFLISELVRFNDENGRPPKAKDLEGNKKYPSRKTYEKYFGSFSEALIQAGFSIIGNRSKPLPKGMNQFTKEEIKRCMDEFVRNYNRVPSLKEFESIPNYPIRSDFRRLFGGYNNALKEFGYNVHCVIQYTDKELKDAFLSFVDKHGRVPTIYEFNNSEYPSFWCYQKRFGSWTNAIKQYGFNPTGRKEIEELKSDIIKLCKEINEKENRKIITFEDINKSEYCSSVSTYIKHFKKELDMTLREFLRSIGFDLPEVGVGMNHEYDDGEITESSLEFIVTEYLRKCGLKYNIDYKRSVKYKTFINGYNGNKNCDYVIYTNNSIWYIEVAGMLHDEDDKNKSSISKGYRKNLNDKIRMLESENLNYLVIYKKDLQNKSLDEIFSFSKARELQLI